MGIDSMGISGSKNAGTVPYKGRFSRDIPLHRPYIGLIYGRYIQFRFLKWALIDGLSQFPTFVQHIAIRRRHRRPFARGALWWYVKAAENHRLPGMAWISMDPTPNKYNFWLVVWNTIWL